LSNEEKTKIEYFCYVEAMLSQKTKEAMLLLLDMGYLDFKKNEMLLTKNNGSIEGTVNDLEMVL
jgi:hypothetical protein